MQARWATKLAVDTTWECVLDCREPQMAREQRLLEQRLQGRYCFQLHWPQYDTRL